jgi:hypothetical protein
LQINYFFPKENHMKKLISVAIVLSISLFAFGCKKDKKAAAGDECAKQAKIVKKCFKKDAKVEDLIKECKKDAVKNAKDPRAKEAKVCMTKHGEDCKALMNCFMESAKKGMKKVAPKVDAKKVAPKVDAKKVAPKVDAKKVAPKVDAKKVAPKVDAKKVAPKK